MMSGQQLVPTAADASAVVMDAKLMLAADHADYERLKDLPNKQDATKMVASPWSKQSSAAEPTPSVMNPLLQASARSGSWKALKFLFSREDAQAPPMKVPTQAFLQLLMQDTSDHSSGGSMITINCQAPNDVEEGVANHQPAPPAASLLEGVTVEGHTALHVVASHGDGEDFLECAHIIYHRAQAEHLLVRQNKKGDTPLHCAVRAGRSLMVSHLIALASGEDTGGERTKELVRKENGRKETVLHEAVRIGNQSIIEFLMAVDPELASFPTDGTSPLYLAILQGRDDIARSLYDKSGGNLSYSGPNGQNALHAAVLRSQVSTNMLLAWNIDLTAQGDHNGSTPLHFAASMLRPRGIHFRIFRPWFTPDRSVWDSTQTFNLVLQANLAAMYQSDDDGLYPIHIAASTGVSMAIIKFLEKCHNVADLCDINGRTFLHVAIQKKKPKVVAHACITPSLSWILNMQDKDGNTALHLAIKLGDKDIFCLLLENKEVQLDITNNDGETPLDLSESRLSNGSVFAWRNPRFFINMALKYCHAKRGNHRLDHFEEKYTQREDEQKLAKNLTISTQTLGLGSVLIAGVAFNASFTLPGNYKSDGSGMPALSGRYAFDAFIVAISLAFACSGLSVLNLMYSGTAIIDVPMRSKHFDIALFFAFGSATSLATAFVLGLYLELVRVAHRTAVVICAFAILVSVWTFVDPLRGHAVARALQRRMGSHTLVIFARLVVLESLSILWPMIAIFSWAAISTRYHHK